MQRQTKLKNKLFTKAFSRVRAGGSLNPGVSYGEGRADAEALALFPLHPLTGEIIEPLSYLSYVEGAVCDFKVGGYKKGASPSFKRVLLSQKRAAVPYTMNIPPFWDDLCKIQSMWNVLLQTLIRDMFEDFISEHWDLKRDKPKKLRWRLENKKCPDCNPGREEKNLNGGFVYE